MTGFAAAAEEHLDDVHGYLLYLTGDRSAAVRLAELLAERGDLDGLRARADGVLLYGRPHL